MNLTSDTFLSAHCIECDNAPTQVQQLYKDWNRRDFIGLVLHFSLCQNQPMLTRPSTHQVQSFLCPILGQTEPFALLPSTAIKRIFNSSINCFTHRWKHCSNCCGSIRSNTRRNVSSLRMPFGRARNVDNQACLLMPYNSMSSQPLPPARTDRIAIVKMSDNRCKRVRLTLWSSSVAKHACKRSR